MLMYFTVHTARWSADPPQPRPQARPQLPAMAPQGEARVAPVRFSCSVVALLSCQMSQSQSSLEFQG
jgi:hypothetical protein